MDATLNGAKSDTIKARKMGQTMNSCEWNVFGVHSLECLAYWCVLSKICFISCDAQDGATPFRCGIQWAVMCAHRRRNIKDKTGWKCFSVIFFLLLTFISQVSLSLSFFLLWPLSSMSLWVRLCLDCVTNTCSLLLCAFTTHRISFVQCKGIVFISLFPFASGCRQNVLLLHTSLHGNTTYTQTTMLVRLYKYTYIVLLLRILCIGPLCYRLSTMSRRVRDSSTRNFKRSVTFHAHAFRLARGSRWFRKCKHSVIEDVEAESRIKWKDDGWWSGTARGR